MALLPLALAIAGALSMTPALQAQTTLAAGDVAVVGYNTSASPDHVLILVLKQLNAGTVFFVNDNEIAADGGGTFTDLAEGEASFTVKAGQSIPAGTVISLPWGAAAVSTTTYDYSTTSGFGLGNNNEEFYIYTASAITSATPTAFIYGAKIGTSPSSRPAGLTTGTTFISPTGSFSRYKTTGATYSGSQSTLLTAIGNIASNWEAVAPGAVGDWTFTLPSLPTVNLSVSANSGSEAAATVITVTATASAAVTGDQTVNLAVTGTGISAGDYTLSGSTITILNSATTGTATFTVFNDSDIEGTETATLTISNPSSGVTLGATTTQNVTITDDDAPLAAPTFTLQPAPSQSVAYNATANLTAAASGNPTPTYQWYQGNSGDTSTPVGTASSSFTTPALTANTSYWVRASNGQGSPADSNTASITVTLSNVSTLSALTLSSGTLAPTFASGTLAYTAGVSNATSSPTVTPTATNSFATIQARVNGGSYSPVTSGSPSSSLGLNLGPNTVDVLVTAQDGVATSLYTVTVTRSGPSVLVAGDLMFTAINADEDGFAMVALKDIPANSTVYFCDNEWDGVSAFNTGEGYLQWDSGASVVAAGTVIRFLAIDAVGRSASVGSLTLASGSSGFSSGEESIYAYQADSFSGTPAFISAICNRSFGTVGAGSLAATGLSIGNGAIETGNAVGSDFAEFTASRSNQLTFAAYLPIASNIANWTDSGDGSFATTVPNTTPFTIIPPASATVGIAATVSTAEGDSGSTPLVFAVTRSADTTAFSVNYAVTGGTAGSGTDYTALAGGTLTFPASNAVLSQNITVDVLGDTALEADETIVITLSSLVPTTGTTTLVNATGTGTITNDDVGITTQPVSTTLTTGKVTTLVVAASGNPTPTIQWYQGNAGDTSNPVSGATSSVFLTPTLNVNTSFWARATSGAKTVDSATATVTIVPGVTSVDLATYIRVGRHNLPHPSRDPAPANNLLAEESSGVAYNWDTDTLFVIGDGGQSITQVTKTGVLVNTMTLPLNAAKTRGVEFDDPEGITYIGGGQFVFTEERDRQAVKFTYVPGTTLARAATQTMKLGTTIGNIGLEGICYDPQTSGFLFTKESGPLGIFQTTIDFNTLPPSASNGSPTTVNSTNLFDPALAGTLDMSDVFAFSNIPSMTGQPQAGNLLIISQESAKIVNIDRTGNVSPNSLTLVADPGNITIQDQTHEGIVMDPTGLLYVVSENGGGTSAFPQVWVFQTTNAVNQAPTAVALSNTVISLADNTNTTSAVKVADIGVTDDGLGVNTLSLIGTDASFFEITGNALFLKAGTALSFTTKPSYAITVQVDDTSVGNSPDATVNYSLAITAAPVGVANLIISEVAPWSSGNSSLASDWFEVTNIGTVAADITGWRVDDSGPTIGTSVALNGITNIAPGESVIFIESAVSKSTLFTSIWFGGIAPAGIQIGTYTGSGIGLSTGGDAVNLFDSGGTIRASVNFGSNAPVVPGPYRTFDNAAGANNATLTTLSSVAVNGAYSVTDVVVAPSTTGSLIGSPGIIAGTTPIISITATDAAASEEGTNPGTFRVSRTGSLIGPLTANFTVATGAGQATAADFTPSIGTSVVIPSSQSFVDITITPVADSLGEGNETLTLTLFDTGSYDVGSPDTATVTIADSRFGTWLATNGYTSTGLGNDTDGDGIKDGVEFFFNMNPNNGAGFANMPQLFPNGGAMELDFTRLTNFTGVGATLQLSGDLTTWTPALLGLDYTVASSVVTGDETAFTYALPGTGPSAPGTSATYLTPNTSDPVGASLGGVRVINEGLVGVGRLSGENLDKFGETQGAASGLFITDWTYATNQFSGTFNVLPDRGHGDGTSNYSARLHEVDFTFTPYYGTTAVPQNQVALTYADSAKFTYQDGAKVKFTTGLNPTGTSNLFGQTVGTITTANGPGGAQETLLSIDAEAVHLFPDGSGYFSDEYGTYIARFDATKKITGLTQLPGAAQPFRPAGTPNFDSVTAPTTGRRNNQGLEGMSVSPDGTRLFALLQSATVQDTNGANQQTRNNARLFVYDIVGANRENPVLVGEYVVKLPQIDLDPNTAPSALNGTAAQSEIVALGNSSFLMLPRDGNGLGKGTTVPITFKSVQLVDIASATNILGLYDAVGEQISPAGVLRAGINAAASAEIINILEPTDLAKFGLNTTIPANANTINEKIEGMALVPDISTPAANDFFLFVANDNDFQSSDVKMLNAAGVVVSKGDGRLNAGVTNDAMFYVWRLTIDAGGKKFFRMKID